MIPKTPIQIQTLEIYPTFDKFTDRLKPANLLTMYDDIKTIEESIAEERLTLLDINEIYTDGKSSPGVNYFEKWLTFLQDFLNINNRLTQPTAVAVMLYNNHNQFYLTDLKIIFEKIMRAEYGTFYGSVDAQRIIYSFAQYHTQRTTIIHSILRYEEMIKTMYFNEIQIQIKSEIWAEVVKLGLEKEEQLKEFHKRCNAELEVKCQERLKRIVAEKNNIQDYSSSK